jgi:glycosyltransferase involved in cell wall biosynthesis
LSSDPSGIFDRPIDPPVAFFYSSMGVEDDVTHASEKNAVAPKTKAGGGDYLVTIMLTSMGVLIVLWWVPPLAVLVYAGRNSQWSTVFALVAFFYWQLNQTHNSPIARRDTFLAATLYMWRLFLVPVLLIYLSCKDDMYRIVYSAVYILCRLVLKHYSAGCKTEFSPGDTHIRILLAGDSFWPKVDGVATFTEHAIKQLVKKGHKVHVLTSRTSTPILFGADVTRLPGVQPEMCPDHSASIPTWKCITTLRDFKPHAVHVFDPSVFSILMIAYCYILDVPISMSHHTRIDLYTAVAAPWAPDRLAKGLITVLQSMYFALCGAHLPVCRPILKQLQKAGCRDVRLWVSGVAVETYKPDWESAETRKMLSRGRSDLPLVLHVGRITYEKDIYDLAEAIEKFHDKYGSDVARFAVVGDGPCRKELEVRLKGKAHFTGFLRGKDLYSAYASSDMFVSSCTTEGFPLVYLEAMASGLSVCGPRAGGVQDTFTSGVEGVMYPPHDTAAAADAIHSVLSAGQPMRDAARKRALTFTWERCIDELFRTIHDVAREGSKNFSMKRFVWAVLRAGYQYTIGARHGAQKPLTDLLF